MVGRRLVTHWLALTVLLAAAGCKTDLYRWGSYEPSIARMYATESGYDPAAEVDRLAREVEETEHRGAKVPPGVRAHLGYLVIEAGNAERGTGYLLAEKTAYPESAAFVDGLLARLRAKETGQ